MSIWKQTSFEGGTPNDPVTEATSGLDLFIAPLGLEYVDDPVAHGSVAVRLDSGGGGHAGFTVPTNVVYARAYLWFPDGAGQGWGLRAMSSDHVVVSDSRRNNNTGRWQMRDRNAAVDQSAGVIPLQEWIRVEYLWDQPGGTQETRLYWGDDLHGETPTEVLTGSLVNEQRTLTAVHITSQSTATLVVVDAFAVGDDWIGPVGPEDEDPAGPSQWTDWAEFTIDPEPASPPAGATFYEWDGTQLIPLTVAEWDGTQLVPLTVGEQA